MKVNNIIQAWKNEEVLENLNGEERALLPENPAGGVVELSAEELARVGGDGIWTVITTSSWVCGVTVTITVCDELQDAINEIELGEPEPVKFYCFAEGTPVRTASGQQPIESFLPGDAVLAFDAEAGAVREARVLGLDAHEGSFPVLDLRSGGQQVEVTPGHVFHGRDGWSYVEQLRGQHCLDIRERSQPVAFAGARKTSKVYNLKVEGLGSYYVGDSDLLVRDH